MTPKSYRWVNNRFAHTRCVPKDADVTPKPYQRRKLDDPAEELMELLEKESEDSEAKTEKINQGGEPFALKPRLQHSEDHHAANGDPDEQSDDSDEDASMHKEEVPQIIKAEMQEMDAIEQAMLQMAEKEHHYRTEHDASIAKKAVKMCVGLFGSMVKDNHAHRQRMIDEHHASWKPIVEFMEMLGEDVDLADLVPMLQSEKDEEAAKLRKEEEMEEKKLSVLDDCEHWVQICKVLGLTGE